MFKRLNRGKHYRIVITNGTGGQRSLLSKAVKPVEGEGAEAKEDDDAGEDTKGGFAVLQHCVNPKVPPMFVWSAVMAIKRMVRARSKRKQVCAVNAAFLSC